MSFDFQNFAVDGLYPRKFYHYSAAVLGLNVSITITPKEPKQGGGGIPYLIDYNKYIIKVVLTRNNKTYTYEREVNFTGLESPEKILVSLKNVEKNINKINVLATYFSTFVHIPRILVHPYTERKKRQKE